MPAVAAVTEPALAIRRHGDGSIGRHWGRRMTGSEPTVLCVCHEIPVRYAINMAAGSDDFDAPLHDVRNATPYVFDAAGLRRAVVRLRTCARR